MKLRTKILLSHAVIILLVIICSGWSLFNLINISQATGAMWPENYRSIAAAENMIAAIERQDSAALLHILGREKEAAGQFYQYEIAFLRWLARAKDNITIPGEEQVVSRLEEDYRDYLIIFSQLHQGQIKPRPAPIDYYDQKLLPSFELVRSSCLELQELNQQTILSAPARAKALSRQAIWSLAVTVFATAGLALLFGLLLSAHLVEPLREMARAAERIAEGDYDVGITVKSADEIGHLAQEIANMSCKLKEIDRLKDEFMMKASHELRTPLTSMGMSIELLLETAEEKLSPREQELLRVAGEEVQRLRFLVDDLLNISKIESGQMAMEFAPVEVKLLVEKAISPFRVQADEKQVKLTQLTPNNLPPVKADPNKITWVLTNLIGNAMRYTDAGGQIQVSARQGRGQVYLSVTDNGTGIPFEYQGKIFDKFVQVKTDKNPGGSGLGLAICQEIVRAHGGTIWVDSTPGEGSCFTFTLPVVAGSSRKKTEGEPENA